MSTKIEFEIKHCPESESVYKIFNSCGVIHAVGDVESRKLICTQSRAAYGECSHWIISVCGYPPRGTIVFDTTRRVEGVAFMIVINKCVLMTQKQYDIVAKFINDMLPTGI